MRHFREPSVEALVIGAKRAATVSIANDENFHQLLENMMDLTRANLEDLSLYRASWLHQLKVVANIVTLP